MDKVARIGSLKEHINDFIFNTEKIIYHLEQNILQSWPFDMTLICHGVQYCDKLVVK